MSLDTVTEAALIAAVRQIAAEEILPRFRALDPADVTTKSRIDDLVTIADRVAEERLTRAAGSILPGAAVVGEEAVSADPSVRDAIATSDRCLIVDPVDGTWNFAQGLPLFGVILAVAERGQSVWGMIYDPVGDDWVIARKGRGAELVRPDGQARPLDFRRDARRGPDAGYVHSNLFQGEERQRLFTLLSSFRRADALRCSAHEYRLMAQGAADFCLSPILNPWDHAAGCLIATEAGGVARLISGENYTPSARDGRLLVARSEEDWAALASRFAPVLAG